MTHFRGALETVNDLERYHQVNSTAVAGIAIGIITIDFDYVKLPGNVANATTFPFPVMYEVVRFEIEQLFQGDPSILQQVIEAAKKLEKRGVRAIVGACGYFNHFQEEVKNAVAIPVYLSSMLQIPMIKMGLKAHQKIAVLVADKDGADREFFKKANANKEDCIVFEIGSLESFAPIRYIKPYLDAKKLTDELVFVTQKLVREHDNIGAILLECSDLPPHASAIQKGVGLPVFDFITLINWVHQAVVQKTYFGYF